MVTLLQENESQIKQAELLENTNFVINVEQARHEVHERVIPVDKIIIEASNEVKVAVLEREREKITEDVKREYRKKLGDMEVNILAYQDLLLTKDAEIRTLEAELIHKEPNQDESALMAENEQLKALMLEK